MLAHWFGRIFRERDAVVVADIVEGFATEGLRFLPAAELIQLLSARLEITVERTVTDVGQCGQF